MFDSIQAMSLLTIMEIVGPMLLLARMPGIRRRRDETFGSSDMEASGGRADRGCQADDSPWRCLLGHQPVREIDGLFEREDVRKLMTMLRSRSDGAAVEVMDATYWMKGCSSLGRLRFTALLKVGKKKKSSLCLTDIKEAVKALDPARAVPQCRATTPNAWSPELEFLRDNWLSNHVFKSYDDLVDHCCAAWNRLIDQPCRTHRFAPMGTRDSDQWELGITRQVRF